MHYIESAAVVTAITTLLTMSELFEPVRKRLPDRPFGCAVCMTYWIALPYLYYGPLYYLALVTVSIGGVFIVAKTYNELADMDYETTSENE